MGSGIANDTLFTDLTMNTSLGGRLMIPSVFTMTAATSSELDDPLDQIAAYGWMRAYRRWESQPITITLPPETQS